MCVLVNKDYHEHDLWYNTEILARLTQYRNVETLTVQDNPVFIHKFKSFPLKMKAYDPDLDENSLRQVLELAHARKIPSLELVTNDRNDTVESLSSNVIKSSFATYLIDLKKEIDVLFANMKNFRRRNIRKAEKSGVLIKHDFSNTIFDTWWNLYLDTARRANFVPQKREFIYDLLDNGFCRLLTGWKDNVLLAGAIIVTNNYPFFWIGASSKEHPEYYASSLLHWQIIRWSRDNAYDLYDFGGASLSETHGPTRFKEAFGGEFRKNIHYEIIFKPLMFKLVNNLRYIYYKKLKKTTF